MNTPNVKYSIIDPNELKKCNEIDPINKAVHFLNSCFEEELCYDFLCIISDDYTNDVNKYHITSNDNNTSNGTFIPTFFQKNPIEKDIIIINWKKRREFSETTLVSIFVHEFVHYLDYRMCPELENKFKIKFSKDIKRNSLDDVIGGYFQNRSEMIAKYFQEKYEYIDNNSKEYIIKQINDNYTKIKSEYDIKDIAYLTGQFLCWKELAEDDNDILSALHFVEAQLNLIWEIHPTYRLDNLFTKESFINKCNELYKIFTNKE